MTSKSWFCTIKMMSNYIQNYFGIKCFLLYYLIIENACNLWGYGDHIPRTPN